MTETAAAISNETRDTKLEIIMGREALDKLADATVGYACHNGNQKGYNNLHEYTPLLLPDWVRQLMKYITIFSILEYCIPELHML